MKRVPVIVGLCVVVLAGSSAFAQQIDIELVPLSLSGVPVGDDFLVDIIVTTDVSLAAVQVVLDSLDPSLTLKSVDAPLADLAFVNPPDTAAMDFFPNLYPEFPPGTFTAGTLTFGTSAVGTFAINLFLQDQSTLSTAVFEEWYVPNWDINVFGTSVTVVPTGIVPEPATVGLLALIGLGAVAAGRRK